MAKRKILLSQAIMGFLLDAEARSLSPHTIADYQNAFRKLQAFLGDPPIDGISADDIRRFLADLSTPRVLAGIAPRPARPIGKKQKLNIHTGLSALWTWAVGGGYVRTHIIHQIERPKPEKPVIVPFTQDDIKRLLAAASRRSAPYTRPGKKECDHERTTAVRDRAILLLLIDTGMRASELCGLELRNVNLRNGGNERTLQDVLGHESLDMLRTYTRIAQVDLINGHQLASPVENWRL